MYAISSFAPVQSHQLFGTWNERNSIRNIEVNVPSREVSKATVCTSRFRRGGTGGCREDHGEAERKGMQWGNVLRRWRMHSNGSRDKEQDQCDSQLSPGLRTRFSHVVLTFLLDERHGCNFKTRLVIEKDPDRTAHFTILIIVSELLQRVLQSLWQLSTMQKHLIVSMPYTYTCILCIEKQCFVFSYRAALHAYDREKAGKKRTKYIS